MRVKDSKNNIIEIEVFGYSSDDIQIESAVYEESGEEVSEEVIEYIEKHYAEELYEAWFERQMSSMDFMGV
jgi:hypothetical protein